MRSACSYQSATPTARYGGSLGQDRGGAPVPYPVHAGVSDTRVTQFVGNSQAKLPCTAVDSHGPPWLYCRSSTPNSKLLRRTRTNADQSPADGSNRLPKLNARVRFPSSAPRRSAVTLFEWHAAAVRDRGLTVGERARHHEVFAAPRQRYRPTGLVPADARVAHLRCRGLRLRHHGSAHRGVHGDTSRAISSLPSHGVMVCEISSDGPPHVSQKWSGSG